MACASFKNMEVFEKKRIVLKNGKKKAIQRKRSLKEVLPLENFNKD
jgi:hypothetical protein